MSYERRRALDRQTLSKLVLNSVDGARSLLGRRCRPQAFGLDQPAETALGHRLW